MSNVVIAESGSLKPKQRKILEDNGYIVIVVDNVDAIKMLPETKPLIVDDGFNLNA